MRSKAGTGRRHTNFQESGLSAVGGPVHFFIFGIVFKQALTTDILHRWAEGAPTRYVVHGVVKTPGSSTVI
jgi:hypothetical protein